MQQQDFTVPLFPLSAHLLPGGRMSLRIFEPRYVRMVKEACAQQTGIGICMLNAFGNKDKNEHIYPVGTMATIEDFTLLEDGLLGITVQGQRCFRIEQVSTESDELRVGRCRWLDEWACPLSGETISPMDRRLKEVFEKYPDVSQLYPEPKFDDPVWVIYRWLELLPVNAEHKQQLLQEKDCSSALKYLSQLVD